MKLETEDGKKIRTTGNHPYLTKQGWQKVANLNVGEEIAVPKENLTALFGNQNNQSNSNGQQGAKDIETSHNSVNIVHDYLDDNKVSDQNTKDKINPEITVAQLSELLKNGAMKTDAKNTWAMSREISERVSNLDSDRVIYSYFNNSNSQTDVKWEQIAKIEYAGEEQVYDIEVEGTHNFIANGIVAHNTYLSGNVGIGTSSPAYGLELMASSTLGYFGVSGSTQGDVFVIDASGRVGVATATPAYALDVWGSLAVGTTTVPAFFVNSDTGLVGIGTTTPAYTLDVVGDLRATATSTFDANVCIGGVCYSSWPAGGAGLDTWLISGTQMYATDTISSLAYGTSSSANYFSIATNTAEWLVVDTNGLVGIGTTSPSALLDLFRPSTGNIFAISSTTAGDLVTIDNSGNVGIGSTTPGYLLTVDGGGATSTVILGVSGGARFAGTVLSDAGGADIAESYPIDPTCQESNGCPEAGDLVSVGENQIIQKSQVSYDSKLIGAVSENAGFILTGGLDEVSSRQVGLVGRLSVKVSLENGLIAIGDYLTSASSTPGVAMKATEPGRVIGMALESYGSSEIGKIMVFINPHWYGGQLAVDGSLAAESSNLSESDTDNSSTPNTGVGSLLADFVQKVKDALASLGLTIENGIAQVKELVTDKLFAKKARIEKLEMVDKATGEIYCTWIENGEWQKVKGECSESNPAENTNPAENSSPSISEPLPATENPPLPEETPATTEPQSPTEQSAIEQPTEPTQPEQPAAEQQPTEPISSLSEPAATP